MKTEIHLHTRSGNMINLDQIIDQAISNNVNAQTAIASVLPLRNKQIWLQSTQIVQH